MTSILLLSILLLISLIIVQHQNAGYRSIQHPSQIHQATTKINYIWRSQTGYELLILVLLLGFPILEGIFPFFHHGRVLYIFVPWYFFPLHHTIDMTLYLILGDRFHWQSLISFYGLPTVTQLFSFGALSVYVPSSLNYESFLFEIESEFLWAPFFHDHSITIISITSQFGSFFPLSVWKDPAFILSSVGGCYTERR